MKALRRALAPILATALVLTSPVSAQQNMQWGFARDVTSTNVEGACVSSALVWVQELGLSGITRLRAKFELRGYYDSTGILPTYLSSGWKYSKKFPDDSGNRWKHFGHSFRHLGGLYRIYGVFIGERPSFWDPDLKMRGDIGAVGCEIEFAS